MRSLHAKLSLALLALLLVVGAATVVLTIRMSRLHAEEVQQKLNRELAEHLVSHHLLVDETGLRQEGLEELFHGLMVINPDIEVYLLDTNGKILKYSAPPGHVVMESVSLDPVHRLLAEDARLPILGDDPRGAGARKIFSAASLRPEGQLRGYLYVVLKSEKHDSVTQLLQGSYILRVGTLTLAGILVATLLGGLAIFSYLTRRLRRLKGEMAAFEAEHLSKTASGPVAGKNGDDMVQLTSTFRNMAGRIREQFEQLEEKDRQRRELVAHVSHDLRTPLTHLQGYLETLLMKHESLTDDQRREYLTIGAHQSERLGQLVADLFELSKLDARDEALQHEVFSATELAQDVVQKFGITARRSNVSLVAEVPRELAMVSAHLSSIERVLDNLIENALRYTPDGGQVTVAVASTPGGVRMEVRDTGPGIPVSELPYIFERFYRTSAQPSRPYEGTGLGLAIAKRIVELHGGDLVCESVPDSGAVFRFELGAARPRSAEPVATS